VSEALAFLEGLPPWLVYGVLAAGAGIENVLPVLPADTFIAAGGLLAGRGTIGLAAAFFVVWGCNVAGAMAVYAVGSRHGPGFFETRTGRRVANEGQIERLTRFYERWGLAAVCVSRFLPGFRALVPAFAGVARQGAWRVAPPLMLASALWYGTLLRLGHAAGENLDAAAHALGRANRGLLAVSLILAAGVIFWWARARRTAKATGSDG